MKKVRMTRSNVLIRPLDSKIEFRKTVIVLPDAIAEFSQEGEVLAVGDECIYLSPGDRIIYNRAYAQVGDSLNNNDEELDIVLEEFVYAKIGRPCKKKKGMICKNF